MWKDGEEAVGPGSKETLEAPPMAADGSVAPKQSVPSLGLGISPVEQKLKQEHPSTSVKVALTDKEGKNVEAWGHSSH